MHPSHPRDATIHDPAQTQSDPAARPPPPPLSAACGLLPLMSGALRVLSAYTLATLFEPGLRFFGSPSSLRLASTNSSAGAWATGAETARHTAVPNVTNVTDNTDGR